MLAIAAAVYGPTPGSGSSSRSASREARRRRDHRCARRVELPRSAGSSRGRTRAASTSSVGAAASAADGREARQEAREVGDRGLDPGLLQHHLRDPDRAQGSRRPPPGQVAAVRVVPGEQSGVRATRRPSLREWFASRSGRTGDSALRVRRAPKSDGPGSAPGPSRRTVWGRFLVGIGSKWLYPCHLGDFGCVWRGVEILADLETSGWDDIVGSGTLLAQRVNQLCFDLLATLVPAPPDSARSAPAIASRQARYPAGRDSRAPSACSDLSRSSVSSVRLLVAVGGILLARRGSGAARSLGGERGSAPWRSTRRSPEQPLDADLPFPASERRPSLAAALSRPRCAARSDPRVVGARALRSHDADFGLAKAQELRRQLAALRRRRQVRRLLPRDRRRGRRTAPSSTTSPRPADDRRSRRPARSTCSASTPTGRSCAAASTSSQIEPSFLTAGEFKSAAEIFTERAHSPAARVALDALLDGYLRPDRRRHRQPRASASRRRARAGSIARRSRPPRRSGAGPGRRARAIPTSSAPRLEEARRRASSSASTSLDYAAASARGAAGGKRVAVLFAHGTIVRGGGGSDPWSGETFLGSDDLAAELARARRGRRRRRRGAARRQPRRLGARLRPDPARGRAARGEEAGRRLDVRRRRLGRLLHRRRATRIVAEPATITGSIGVVTGKLATGRFQEELLGVTHDPLQRGANADLYSTLDPFDERQSGADAAAGRRDLRPLPRPCRRRPRARPRGGRGGRAGARLDRRRRPRASAWSTSSAGLDARRRAGARGGRHRAGRVRLRWSSSRSPPRSASGCAGARAASISTAARRRAPRRLRSPPRAGAGRARLDPADRLARAARAAARARSARAGAAACYSPPASDDTSQGLDGFRRLRKTC